MKGWSNCASVVLVAVPRELDQHAPVALLVAIQAEVAPPDPDLVTTSSQAAVVALLVALLNLQVETVAPPDLVTPSRLAMVQA